MSKDDHKPAADLAFAAPRRRAPLWRLVLAIVLAVVFLLLAGEGILRVREWREHLVGRYRLANQDRWLLTLEPANDTLFRMRAGTYPDFAFTINSMGGRGAEVGKKPAGGLRFLALGDSTVFGYGVTEDEAWTSLLQDDLTRRLGRPIEVLNFALISSSSRHALAELRRLGEQLEVDGLIVGVGAFNDYTRFHEDPESTEEDFVRAGAYTTMIAEADTPLQHLALYRAYRKLHWREFDALGGVLNEQWQKEGLFGEDAISTVRRVPPEAFRANVDAICSWGHEHDVPVFFLTHALRPTEEPKWAISRVYRRIVEEEATACGAHLVPAAQALLAFAEGRPETEVWWDWVHLTPAANRVVAQVVADSVVEALAASPSSE